MGFMFEKTADLTKFIRLNFGSSGANLDPRDSKVDGDAGRIRRNIEIPGFGIPDRASSKWPEESPAAIGRRKIEIPGFGLPDQASDNSPSRIDPSGIDKGKIDLPGFGVPLQASSAVLEKPSSTIDGRTIDAAHRTDASPEEIRQFALAEMVPRGRAVILTLAVGAVAACGIYFLAWPTPRSTPPSSNAIAAAPPPQAHVDLAPKTQPKVMATPVATPVAAPLAAPVESKPEPKAQEPSAQTPEIPDKRPLDQDGVLEVQVFLKAFGFDPGLLDGLRGPQTAAAVKRYQAARGRQQTGKIDRETLGQLRQDSSLPIKQAQPPRQTKP